MSAATGKPAGTLLGFDFGDKRVGVAVGQTVTGAARELVTLNSHCSRPDWEGITALIAEWQPVALVVGLPLDADGGEQAMTHRARRFRNQLRGRYNLPVYLVDERYTSMEAERQLKGGRSAVGDVDRVAAALILQAWLDENA